MKFNTHSIRGGIHTAAFAAILLIIFTVVQSSEKPRGDINDEKALVYLIQPDGPRRHLFARQEWLGTVDDNTYIYTHLDPGEHFLWAGDARALGSAYLAPGSANYMVVRQKEIDVVDPAAGEALLAAAAHSAPRATDRGDSYKKVKKYRKAYARALKAGLFEACRFAAEKRDDYDRRVKAGNAQASHILGNLYWYGECVEQDYPTAVNWYQDAARKGHLGAMVTLGNIYYRGTHVRQDPAQSAIWYRMAAEEGDLFSQRRLAEMYRDGHGVEADTGEAIKWFRRAAEEGNDQWALIQLEAIDPELQEQRRLEADAKTRAKEEQKKKLEANRQRINQRRLARISGKYGELALDVRPLQLPVKLEPPSRKKPEEDGNSWDSSVAYMLPPEIALGVMALGMMFNAVEKSLDSRLSGEEKEHIESAAAGVARMLTEEPVSYGLTSRIVAVGRDADGTSLFVPASDRDLPAHDTEDAAAGTPATDTIVEVETTGIGLMLADKRYRQSHFVMANHIRVRRRDDSIVLKDRALCYASNDTPNFSVWAANGGARIREELTAAYTHTADTILLILADEAYSTNSRNNELCAALKVTVEKRKAALSEPER